jgi:hypothetical protein
MNNCKVLISLTWNMSIFVSIYEPLICKVFFKQAKYTLFDATPSTYCNGSIPAPPSDGFAVAVMRGNCSFVTKAWNVLNVGGVAAFIVSQQPLTVSSLQSLLAFVSSFLVVLLVIKELSDNYNYVCQESNSISQVSTY